MQKKANSDKDKLETSQQSAISTIEQKYLNQIKELQETHQRLYSELLNANKELERENKNLTLQAEIKGRSNSDSSALLHQIDELSHERNKYKKDFDDLKNERDKQLLENLSNNERDKMLLKLKISDTENKVREIESKRGSLMLDYEKDKAKWSIERDNLVSKNLELQENLERIEKKNETLLRENEKLKSDKINSKRSISKGVIAGATPSATFANLLGATRESYRLDGNNPRSLAGMVLNNMHGSSGGIGAGFGFGSSNNSNSGISSSNSNNLYAKEINKILDNSGIENNNSNNNSRIMGEKSMEKIELKFDPRYDSVNSKFETFGKSSNNSNVPVRPSAFLSKPSIFMKSVDEDNGNNFESLLNKK